MAAVSGKQVATPAKELVAKAVRARRASRELAGVATSAKNAALRNIADALLDRSAVVLAANEQDLDAGREARLAENVLGRLVLNEARLGGMATDVLSIAALPDPVGETTDERVLPNGLRAGRRRVPLGVIGAIYESRPNVTVDISALCLKSGNAVILRGGKEAINSNTALARLVRESVERAGVPEDAVQFVESTDRSLVSQMLRMKEYIDLIVPRGGADLVHRVADEAEMPAITGGIGVCHAYVDRSADLEMAINVVNDSKVTSPYVCNALDTVLVHSSVAPAFLQRLAALWADAGVEMRCDGRAMTLVGPVDGAVVTAAGDEDWGTEFLALTAAVRVVDSLDEALEHIDEHGSGHTDAIVTEDYTAASRFLDAVDSSMVVVNASTRFNDGARLGLGAEVAISTNKMHARGPMGLRELTTYKWTVQGSGQVTG